MFNPQKDKAPMGERINSHLRLIRERLLSGGSITPFEALRDFGCYRLARISDLRKEGLNIKKTMEKKRQPCDGSHGQIRKIFFKPEEMKQRPKHKEGIK